MTRPRTRAPRVVLFALVAALAPLLVACDSSGGVRRTTKQTQPSSTGTPTPPLVAAACAGTLVRSTPGTLQSAELDETSGLVVSAKNPKTLWLNNDSGDSARVFAVTPTGALRGIYPFDGATAIDWEDIAIGPGPKADTPYLYAGDIGDNGEARANIVVYRVAEPKVAGDGGTYPLAGVDALTLKYPDGPHDAEALMVDPGSGELYIIIKHLTGGPAAIYRAPANLTGGSTTALTQVGTLDLSRTPFVDAVTAADISPDGRIIGVRTYGGVRLFARSASQSVVAALGKQPCQGPLPAELQGEALGFSPDGQSYFTVAEGVNAPLHEFSRPPKQ